MKNKCPFCEISCGNDHCAYNEKGNDVNKIKTNLLEVDITDSFIAGRLTGKIETLQELLDLGINNKQIRETIEIKLKANEDALRVLQNPTEM